ncbi:hypothetical protein LSH36_137g05039 [Paralvinella palmiformis]|uniref:Dynein heavy chain C-terminal domain-containing protein n=1 Tax=Paralvinella palmiformis TaxID=53620 RepID=A0AAD9JW11_9ANNE|nr:hypothetical protein LSH36_137g05039 [Paralvinella palmiformis]
MITAQLRVLQPMKRTIENIKDPLFRFFEREVNAGISLLDMVRRDMTEVMLICQGEKKPTNYHRTLISELAKAGLTVIQWITDFSERIKQLQKISKSSQSVGSSALKNLNVWLGGLFIPEAYITATRQFVAQANSWSLEELHLQLDDCSFGVLGLIIQGAKCKNNLLQLSSAISTQLPLTSLKWIRLDTVKPSVTRVTLPLYLNAGRGHLLFTVDFETKLEDGDTTRSFYERGVAIISSNLGS